MAFCHNQMCIRDSGGRDVRVEDMENIYETLKQVIADGDAGEMYRYMGIRE